MGRLTASAGAYGTDGNWLDLGLMGRAGQVGEMVVKSAVMADLMRLLARLSAHRTTVLIHGESGTGKELVARAVWNLRPEPRGPFITFNCSNLVDTLAESQLFGHVKGAFTDAREDSQGYFRAAEGGVLFLDEVGEMPMGLQAKLLRAVEYHEVQPVGSTRMFKVGVQIVAATNRDLRKAVEEGRFRADLFYRLNVASVVVPPLRERLEAIDALVSLFVERCNREFGTSRQVHLAPRDGAAARLWMAGQCARAGTCDPLRAAAQRLRPYRSRKPPRRRPGHPAAFQSRRRRDGCALLPAIRRGRTGSPPWAGPVHPSCPSSLRELTRDALVSALSHARGNRQRAARILGVSRTTLYRMLMRYGLESFGREDDDEGLRLRTASLRLVKAEPQAALDDLHG